MSMDPSGTNTPLPDPVKPGLFTTEWWTTLMTVIASVVISIFALFGKNLDGSSLQPIIGAVAILAAGISSAYYSHSRGHVKAAASNALARQSSYALMSSAVASPILPAPAQVPPRATNLGPGD